MKRKGKKKKKRETHTNEFFNSEVFFRTWLSCSIQRRAGCSASVLGCWRGTKGDTSGLGGS